MREVFRHHGLPNDIIMIVDRNLSLTFGNTYVMGSKSLANSLQHIIPKLTAKHSAQIKHLSSIFDVSSVIDKMIGVIYCILQSLHTITPYTLLPRSHLSMPILATILDNVSWTFPWSQQTLVQSYTSLNPLQHLQSELSSHLQKAQAQHKAHADRHRLLSPFKVGDGVWLLRRHIKTTQPCDKLDYKRLGHFVITKRINHATFRLDLHANLRLHPVYRSSLSECYHTSSIPNTGVPPPPPLQLATWTNVRGSFHSWFKDCAQ